VTGMDGALLRSESVQFLGLEAPVLADMARRAGGPRVEFFGGYGGQPYDRVQSTDLVMLLEN